MTNHDVEFLPENLVTPPEKPPVGNDKGNEVRSDEFPDLESEPENTVGVEDGVEQALTNPEELLDV